MSLNVLHGQFQQTWQRLNQQWQKTTALWDDPVRWRFEHDFWKMLERQVPAALQTMEHLARVIAQAQQHVR